jgi:carbon-monoxide dehydrogenase medium subunit
VGPPPLLGGPVPPFDLGSAEELERAVDDLLAPATPIGDVRAGLEYRTAMVRVLARRAILRAAARRTGPARPQKDTP